MYRWRVNMLLRQSDLGLRLADEAEDIGRTMVTTSDSRAELVAALVASEGDTGDQIRHAVALFRRRGADQNEKRSAVVSLGRVLENKRKLLRAELLIKGEDALFLIANKFDIRHQNEGQTSDYAEAFLDWVSLVVPRDHRAGGQARCPRDGLGQRLGLRVAGSTFGLLAALDHTRCRAG